MNTYLGNESQFSKSFWFEISVGPQPETFESYMKRIFATIGLRDDYSIKAFNRFIGQSFYASMINNAKNNADVTAVLKNPNGKIFTIKDHIFPSIVEKLEKFGINLLVDTTGKVNFSGHFARFQENITKYQDFKPISSKPINQWSTLEKLDAVIRRAALLLPEDVGKELLGLLEPLSLAIMAVVVTIWAVSHFFGAGQIADVILIFIGGFMMGPVVFIAAERLILFAMKTIYAEKEEDLDKAAEHLSKAISMLGVQVVMSLLLLKAPKVFRTPQNTINVNLAETFTMKTIGEPPITKGEWFYKPKDLFLKNDVNPVGNSGGYTNQWGDITLVISKDTKAAQAAIMHEKVHSFLAPKLQMFPKLRQAMAVIKSNSYLKSYILRYLEEAIAETVGKMSAYGVNWRNLVIGYEFPFGTFGGDIYVTKAAMKTEAMGILLGPINVSGMTYYVYYSQKNRR